MSLANALEFIQQVRADETLRAQVAALADETTFEPLVQLGAARGLIFTPREFQIAFQHDWMMRWLRVHPPKA